MRRSVIGILAGMGAFLGASLAAEAQIKIDGKEPATVYHTDSQSTYVGTVTWTGTFKWRLKVLLGAVEKWPGTTFTVSSPGPTIDVSQQVTGMNTWGMLPGLILTYRGKAWVTTSNQDTDNWLVTIQLGSSKLIPDRKKPPLGDPNREVLLADVVRREERDQA